MRPRTTDRYLKCLLPHLKDTQIKDLITPSKEAGAHLSAEEQAAVRDMYIKSHKSYAPGEQWHRQYKWTDAQLMATWGAPSAQAKSAEETVKDSLKWAADTER